MNDELYIILNEILKSHKDLVSCTNAENFLSLIYEKPPFYHQKKENIIRFFIDNLVEKNGSVEKVAEKCGVSVETIKKIRNGTRFPSKHLWVKIGLELKIHSKYIDLFMMAAGYSLNTIYIEDVIFYYSIVNKLECMDVYNLLKSFMNEETADSFLSP